MPHSLHSMPSSPRSDVTTPRKLSDAMGSIKRPSTPGKGKPKHYTRPRVRALPSELQHQVFERDLWRNAITLCQVRGKKVEYTVWDDDELDYRLVEAAGECQIYLIQKQIRLSPRDIRYETSIWALNNDRAVRLQQSWNQATDSLTPYTCWGATDKVTLRVPSTVKFHDIVYDDPPLQEAYTGWVNYVFATEAGANVFQSAMMGKTLILSVQTNKTMRVHSSPFAFSFSEQMCALENLRLWHDPYSNGVLAMLHYTPLFRDGYMMFWLNSPHQRVRIRDDGDRFIKIKGLDVEIDCKSPRSRQTSGPDDARSNRTKSVSAASSTSSNSSSSTSTSASASSAASSSPSLSSPSSVALTVSTSKKSAKSKTTRVRGVRIEFTTVEDKMAFLDKYYEVQDYYVAG